MIGFMSLPVHPLAGQRVGYCRISSLTTVHRTATANEIIAKVRLVRQGFKKLLDNNKNSQ
jgi:hypothetical protein